MKKSPVLFIVAILVALSTSYCGPAPETTSEIPPTSTSTTNIIHPTPTSSSTATQMPPTPTPRMIMVTSAADAGPGTLRQALEEATNPTVITFDFSIFPPDAPVTISLTSSLPALSQGNMTIDASNAGVILDGSLAGGEWTPCLILDSEWNTIRGLQIIHFTGAGIALYEHADHNVIGGDPNIGVGPLGQGNLSSGNAHGAALFGAKDNIITGNLIGTDVQGKEPLPNRYSGIWLQDSAQRNVIGPGNILAFNGGEGVAMATAESSGNSITRNIFHDNQGSGISLAPGDLIAPSPPMILSFDLETGIVEGITCPSCIVEVFSGEDGGAEVYEGTAAADQNGTFVFMAGIPFQKTSLTATATRIEGATSEFSMATSGARLSAIHLQDGNHLVKNQIQTRGLLDLANNRVGDMFPLDPISCPTADEMNWAITHVVSLGLKWVRISLDRFEWSQVQTMGLYSSSNVNECQDKIVSWLVENNVTIMYTIVFWDETLHVGANYPRYHTEEEIQRYLDYTRFIVRYFKGRIKYYEILNEPVNGDPQQYVDVADYINLIHRVIPVIREEDPHAKIVVGGATDLRQANSREYLFGVLQSDIMPLVDGIGMHPMYGVSPQYDDTRQYYYDYPAFVQEVRDMASANGFSGEYFAEEMDWRTSDNPYVYEPWEYTPVEAAKYYARGILMNLGMDVWAGIGGEGYDTIPPIVNVVKGLCTSLAGAKPMDFPVEIQSEATNIVSYTFSLTNDDRLVALWADGIAQDDYPGIKVTLNIPGQPFRQAIGIDVLRGFEQQLNVNYENENLVISNLIIMDYPIILRLIP